jgi:hypothetical protein
VILSPTATDRSISFPSMRKARLISFRALICPIKTTGSEITRRSTVTARTDLIWGGGAADCSQAMTPADTKPITAKSLRRMPFPLPFPTGKTASGSLILLAQPK